ncbi:MAG: hypothetical protein H7338_18780 [Candidatus Sericytochromatia bacterium]|nr:hypothetical protein [Candidatus Sericytochromatia bacterium]
MSNAVIQPGQGNTGLEQAKQTNLRSFLPADLEGTKGKKLDISSFLISDRKINSISHKEGSALETCTIVTDKETIEMAEAIDAKGNYGINISITGKDGGDPMVIKGSVSINAAGALVMKNSGSGAIKGITIEPGFANAQFKTSVATLSAKIR